MHIPWPDLCVAYLFKMFVFLLSYLLFPEKILNTKQLKGKQFEIQALKDPCTPGLPCAMFSRRTRKDSKKHKLLHGVWTKQQQQAGGPLMSGLKFME